MPESRAKGAQHTLSWLLNQIIQQSPIGIAVIDADGFYRNVNAAYGNLYGYTERELIGRSFTILFAPELRQHMLQRHHGFLAGGDDSGGEFEVVCRDGSIETILGKSVRIEDSGDGDPLCLVYGIVITERKLAERKLESASAFSESVLDGLSELVHRSHRAPGHQRPCPNRAVARQHHLGQTAAAGSRGPRVAAGRPCRIDAGCDVSQRKTT